ncbi:MAG: hypothetical protein K8R74_10120 [Bacteroidales bacterium]|nr:hypothetical protein [Bacteroidales bacterium]
MKNSFTLNELILIACGEKGEADISDMEVACQTNGQSNRSDRKLSNTDLHNSGLSISPNKRIINNILNYSRALSIVHTKGSGNFNLLMN